VGRYACWRLTLQKRAGIVGVCHGVVLETLYLNASSCTAVINIEFNWIEDDVVAYALAYVHNMLGRGPARVRFASI
jgi:hypothetical protein